MNSPILIAAAALVALGIAAERADARIAGLNLSTHTVRSDTLARIDHTDAARHMHQFDDNAHHRRPHFTLGYLGADGIWHRPWAGDVDRNLTPSYPHPHFSLGYLGSDGIWHRPGAGDVDRTLPPLACKGRPGGC